MKLFEMRKFCFLILSYCVLSPAFAQPESTTKEKLIFINQVACTPVEDQSMSSTCWSFASNSFIESELLKRGIKVDLSEMFIARYSYINKVKQHLTTKGKTFFTPGGQFHDVQRVIREYGLMPEEAYTGKGRNETDHNHAELDTIMKYKMQEFISAGKTSLTKSDLNWVNLLLDKYLGKLPSEFLYQGKKYTAKTFASGYLKFRPDDYIEITSYTHHPFYSAFILEDRYNWTYDKYFNVPLNDFTAITDSALAKGYSICWDGDVTEAGFNFYENTASITEGDIKDFQEERQVTFEDKSSTIDHMMHIVGVAKTTSGKRWYYLKNSWGESNSANGYLFMSDAYFKIKTIAIIVNKAAIPNAIRKKMKI